MAQKRLRLGLLVNVNPQWMAGAYYLLNMVQSIRSIEDSRQPLIVVISEQPEAFDFIKSSGYRYMRFRPMVRKRTFLEAALNKAFLLFGKEYDIKFPSDKDVDLIFPANRSDHLSGITRKSYWIPDFQHHYYPEYFSTQEIEERNDYFLFVSEQEQASLVLSSQSALRDFEKFYPNAKIRTIVVPFAVTLPEYQHLSIDDTKVKYGISDRYFIIPNQFWKHKNHMLVFNAINQLKDQYADIQYVFTGSQNDYRNPGYFTEITKFVSNNSLGNQVVFTGFIAREEQLLLMKNSLSVIQPSLFEGWSTVVEDVKALNHRMILSDISVHREQFPIDDAFFDPHQIQDLIRKIKKILKNQIDHYTQDYTKDVHQFGLRIVEDLLK